jgi:hypothetical protein
MTYDGTFSDYLNEFRPPPATVQQAAILFIGEITDDRPTRELLETITAAVGDRQAVDNALSAVRKDHEVVDTIILEFLCNRWQNLQDREKIERSFKSTEGKLPVIETIVVGAVALYAMYLTAYIYYGEKTGAAVKTTRKVKRNADGSFEETETTELSPPATPHSAVGSLFALLDKVLKGGKTAGK